MSVSIEAPPSIPPCEIRVDQEGRWYYRGAEIIRQEIIALFCQHLEREESGRYIINWNGQRCHLETEDTPLVVWETGQITEAGDVTGVLLHLSDGSEERLAPDSLFIGFHHVPYCLVRGGSLPARFSRKAYYQLAAFVEEDVRENGFFLRIGCDRFPIREGPRRP